MPEHNKTLSPPAILEGEHEDVVDTLQKGFCVGEVNWPKSAQNLRVPVFRLPTEILSNVFLHLVESGLECHFDGDASFASWTFNFLQVCRHWNEVAIGFPQLWVRWVVDAVEAWPLFNARSKNTPIFLTWRSELPESTRDVLADTETPRRIRQLDFHGTRAQLEHILGALGPGSTSTTSLIRVALSDWGQNGEHLIHFLSSPFPKLSHLDIRNFLPDSSSSIFTTSNLTSLKLDHFYNHKCRYTRSQFSQILQRHPNLQKLDLGKGAMPPVEGSRPPVQVILPRLVDLRLHGMEAVVVEFLGLVSMSSPLHNVIILLDYVYTPRISALAKTAETILVPYYKCQGLEYPRDVDHLAISRFVGRSLEFSAGGRSTPAPHLTPSLTLKFQFWIREALVPRVIRRFPLKGVREFTAMELDLSVDNWRGIFREMSGLLDLRLNSLSIEPVLDALDFAPKLRSLTLLNLEIHFERQKLLDVLEERRNHQIGLESLVVESCCVLTDGWEADLMDRVERVVWSNVTLFEFPITDGPRCMTTARRTNNLASVG